MSDEHNITLTGECDVGHTENDEIAMHEYLAIGGQLCPLCIVKKLAEIRAYVASITGVGVALGQEIDFLLASYMALQEEMKRLRAQVKAAPLKPN